MGTAASQPRSSPCEYESEPESYSDYDSDLSFPSDKNDDEESDSNDNRETGASLLGSPQDDPTTTLTPLQDLLTMSDEELKLCLQRCELTREAIRARSNLLEDDVLGVFGWYHDYIQINTVDGTVEETVRSHTEVAMFLLSISPELRSLRFKMVPAKVSECNFWGSIFSLLQDGSPSNTHVIGSSGSKVFSNKIISEKDAEISLLRKKLTVAEMTIKELKENGGKSEKRKTGKGKWIMDKDSQDFLSLDKVTRDKLREGKKKRLEDVLEQMKFILDGDDESFTRGYWNGCGQTSYYTDN